MSGRFRPYRSCRSELASLALVVAVPFALVSVFPFAALRPLPPPPTCAEGASCAFVTLTPAEERQARIAARAAWQTDRRMARNRRIDLFADALPPMRPRIVLDVSARGRAEVDIRDPFRADMLPPTLAAPPPATIAPQPDADEVVPAFPREELLRLK